VTETQQSPDTTITVALTAALIALYAGAEQYLLSRITRILRRTTPDFIGRVAVVSQIRQLTAKVIYQLVTVGGPMIDQVIALSGAAGAVDGEQAARAALDAVVRVTGTAGVPEEIAGARGAGGPPIPPSGGVAAGGTGSGGFDLSVPHGVRAEAAIRQDLVSELDDVRFRLTRLPDDIYKAITPQGAIQQVLQGNVTPAYAQAKAWRELTANGITGFTDKSGREWSLSAYVEMAVRTSVQRAYNASHIERMHALGIHYFTVPDDGHPCPMCFPWQNKVLTDGPIEHPEMPVDGTIQEAVAAGLLHPNCRHSFVPVIPGVTKLPKPRMWSMDDADRYNQTQKQRRLELNIRKAKKQVEYASDPQTEAEARAKVRKRQAAMRAFIEETGLVRRSRREQLNLTMDQYPAP
jgi:hypothetical protein